MRISKRCRRTMYRAPQVFRTAVLVSVFVYGESVLLAQNLDEKVASLEQHAAAQLETRLTEISDRLDRLAQYTLRSGVGSIGYRSKVHDNGNHHEWIKIDLGEKTLIDQVVIVPTLLRNAEAGFRAEGFPLQFRVVVGTGAKQDATVVASFDAEDQLLPRIAPVVIPFNETTASWVVVEAELLTARQFDGRYLLQFAEILVFSGYENVAQRRPLQTSSNEPTGSPAWGMHFVVDGFMPYLMNGAGGKESLAFVGQHRTDNQPCITIDLESTQSISQINLHLVEQSDTVPQTYSGDFGLPKLLRIEGANEPDLSDASVLIEYRHEDKYDTGPIVVRRFPKTDCRFVSFTVLDPFMVSAGEHQVARIGFAEIELIADGKNVALNKVATGPVVGSNPARSLDALTDGNNYYGQILPLREWLSELASRHDLESELPLIQAELNDRYQRQKVNLSRFMWLAAVLGAGIIVTILVDRLLRQRAVFGIRERIAADVHDEIGANIHAIGLLSDLAKNASESPESLKPLMQRMRELTQRTGTAAAHCANMLESEGLFDDLEQEMRRSSSRILMDLDHELTIKDDNVLRQLKSRKRIDLFLFYKECLINILRHSEATRVVTRLSAQGQAIDLTIVDNGIGMDDSSGNSMPPSLKRRARLLGAHALIDHPECSGTRIVLNMRINKRWILF